ncbi:MAG: NADAR family protein [Erysipelotrichaceae bacterium]
MKFYKVNEEYECFSNFSKHGFILDGKYWMTSEHYFQAKKFEGTDFEEIIRLLDNPMDVAIKGRDRSLHLRKDWEDIKDDIMRKVVLKSSLKIKVQEIF